MSNNPADQPADRNAGRKKSSGNPDGFKGPKTKRTVGKQVVLTAFSPLFYGAALTLHTWPSIPLATAGVICGALALRIQLENKKFKRPIPRNWAIALAVTALAVWGLAYHAKREKRLTPAVALRFVYAKRPALVIDNESSIVAREIKWTVVLWNIDSIDRKDPLPIPVSTFDWIAPHRSGGAQGLFNNPDVARLVKDGDRLVGSASVSCPSCKKRRTYLLSFRIGQGGWYAEKTDQIGDVLIPRDFSRAGLVTFSRQVELAVPERSRIIITQ